MQKLVSAFEDEPDCIHLHMPGQEYILSNEVGHELVNQLLRLLPSDKSKNKRSMFGAFLVSILSIVCGLTLFIVSTGNPNGNYIIAGWAFVGILFQSLTFLIVVWRNNS